MYLVWINPPINFTFSDDSVFLKNKFGGGHKFSEFACLFWYMYEPDNANLDDMGCTWNAWPAIGMIS